MTIHTFTDTTNHRNAPPCLAWNRYLYLFLILMLMAGCQTKPPEPQAEPKISATPKVVEKATGTSNMVPIPWSELPATLFEDQTIQTWADALTQSAVYYRRLPPKKILDFGSHPVSAGDMVKACTELAQLARSKDLAQLKTVLQHRFRLFRSVGNDQGDVLVTGYYEPLLHGSFTRSKRFFYPIYRRPPDLMESGGISRMEKGKRVPYYDRKQIDGPILKGYTKKPSGSLANRGLELVWVDNPIDAFFLHIQGSGRVLLENGQMLRIGYHGANGRPYVAIGSILIKEGKIPKEEMTMPRLRQWLVDNPGENQRLFFANPSYVFFHELSGDPVGNINVPLTKGRSIATDHRLFPKGAPGVLETTLPVFAADGKSLTAWRPEVRFVVNQDTGGAIRGPGRVDLFFGFGEQVEYQAGVMKQPNSKLYFIAPQ
ncbi:MAG: MltA domain-containing protein [Magnetococcus sp. YQC-5]